MNLPILRRAITRRTALASALTAAPVLMLVRPSLAQGSAAPAGAGSDSAGSGMAARLAGLERQNGGRLGVAALNLATGNRVEHRGGERFPMCSTFKVLASALVLARVDQGKERLDRRVAFTKADVITWSPITEKYADGPGLTMADYCEAAITYSDNTAGNMLLDSFGGPAGLTAYLRSLGDEVTRLDRTEPTLNESIPGDPRDTTSPGAMLDTLRRLLFGNALSEASRAQLAAWMIANTTGGKRLRAGFPSDWRVGDKTGTGSMGTANDVAVAWPPTGGPILVTVYYTGSTISDDRRNAVIAEAGRIVAGV